MTYPLVRRPGPSTVRLDLATFSRVAGIHPEMARRLAALGLLEPVRDSAGELWFARDQLLAVARIRRLRMSLGLNYSSLGLVVDLLDRVAELERQLRVTSSRRIGGTPWI
ncbi:chaperone modulator CbpM [Krasilnikovia sp. MM14-A1004]|uniref:chaperone modulator CbpM n=1 Tax=Krasilnikovia sp. MM14-A1004 TaxID=3373541 RepID=UPI00399CFF8B